MKTYVVFSSREPMLIVTRGNIRDGDVVDHLRQIGYSKFISREVPLEQVRQRYGRRVEVVEKALKKGGDLRVLDYSGKRVFLGIPFSEYGQVFRSESGSALS